MIQRNFREYRRFKIIPKLLNQRKRDRITLIQRTVRGFMVWRKWQKKLKEARVKRHHSYFNVLRDRIENHAGNVIKIYWFRYLIRKLDKREADLNKIDTKQKLVKKRARKNTKSHCGIRQKKVKEGEQLNMARLTDMIGQICIKKMDYRVRKIVCMFRYSCYNNILTLPDKHLDDFSSELERIRKAANKRRRVVEDNNLREGYKFIPLSEFEKLKEEFENQINKNLGQMIRQEKGLQMEEEAKLQSENASPNNQKAAAQKNSAKTVKSGALRKQSSPSVVMLKRQRTMITHFGA